MSRAPLVAALVAALAAALVVASLSQAAADGKRPDVWQRALDPARSDAARETYQRELREGDDHVTQAGIRSSSASAIREQVQRAIEAYRRAAAAQPEAAEPYFRIGMVLWSFYLQNCDSDTRFGSTRSPLADCSAPDAINTTIAEQTIKAWDTFEAKAPLDPRLSGELGGILFSRAIIHTKLATSAHLAAAARDYEAIVQRTDGKGEVLIVTWPNLAETYMMLGRLEDAIDAYRESLRTASRTSTWYGLAVALDRDGRGSLARDVVVAQGIAGFRQFQNDLASHQTFYVPR
ncbi:MAG TPA: tetratricopeptide repeat protein, partial [Kofleriaceae bacterium]|nr:tetratricopeptide repeat protein [Kofleriaceae bacterium]